MAGASAVGGSKPGYTPKSDGKASSSGKTKSTDNAKSNASQHTTTESIASQPTTTEKLAGESSAGKSPDTLKKPAEKPVDKKAVSGNSLPNVDKSLWLNADKSAHIGRIKIEYKAPEGSLDTEKAKAGASAKLSGEVTVADASVKLGPLTGKATLGTVNAHLGGEAKGEYKGLKTSASLSGSGGAEAMAINGRVDAEVSITPKTVGDAVGGAYNTYVDPVVDTLAGRDMPEIPAVPDSWDHGVVLSGHVEGGYGAAAKIGFTAEIGNGKGVKIGGRIKGGIGPVGGLGGTVGVK